MKKINKIILIPIGIFAFSSCSVTTPVLVTDNVIGEKTGEASASVFLGFIKPMNMDLSIQTAAKNGGITEVGSVDYQVYGGLFVSKYKTIVTGR